MSETRRAEAEAEAFARRLERIEGLPVKLQHERRLIVEYTRELRDIPTREEVELLRGIPVGVPLDAVRKRLAAVAPKHAAELRRREEAVLKAQHDAALAAILAGGRTT